MFANIRRSKRLNRFNHRGREKVNMQWILYCMVHNIEKLAKGMRSDGVSKCALQALDHAVLRHTAQMNIRSECQTVQRPGGGVRSMKSGYFCSFVSPQEPVCLIG